MEERTGSARAAGAARTEEPQIPAHRRLRPHWGGELLVVLALAVAYDHLIDLVTPRVGSAVERGRSLLRLEHMLHLDVERGLDHVVAGSHALTMALSDYYDLAHATGTFGVLLLVYLARPAAYRRARNALVAINVTAFVVFVAMPTAPPRLLPDAGFTDVVARSGTWGSWEQSSALAAHANLYASFPSLHVAWALFVLLLVRSTTTRRSLRALAGAHLAVTSLVVLATGNHYLVDVVGGLALTVVAWRATAPEPVAHRVVPEVLLVSASMGAGHDGVAYELARRLRATGVTAEVVDYLTVLPLGVGHVFKRVYGEQLKHAPGSYEWLYSRLDRRGPLQAVAVLVTALARRRLRKLCDGVGTVVATYPLGGRTLGQLRRRGHLGVPALTFLTDAEVHALWLDKGTDLYLAAYGDSGRQASRRTGRPAWACGPVLPPRLDAPVRPQERAAARAGLGLEDERVALLVTGSWGVGNAAATARLVADAGLTPLVLCGRNEQLRSELEADPSVRALGWLDDVRPVYAASDVVVHNAGGLASVEAFAAGIPVVGHACLPGHGHRNAEEMARQGIAEHAPDDRTLVAALHRLAGTEEGAALAGRARAVFQDDPTPLLTSLARSAHPAAAARPSWVRRAAAVAAAVPVLLVGVSFGVSEATERGFGSTAHLPADTHAVYVAAVVDDGLLGSPAVTSALRASGVAALVSPQSLSAHMLAVRQLGLSGVTVLATGPTHLPRSPHGAERAFTVTALELATATGRTGEPLVCLHGLGAISLVEARASHTRFTVPRALFRPGEAPRLRGETLAVLDLRGVQPGHVAQDLAAVEALADAEGLAVTPLPTDWADV